MPCANPVARSCVRSAANAVDAIVGLSRPPGSLIYSDFMSGLGGADPLLGYSLLGGQYEDGVLVGLRPACDDLAFAGLPGVRGMRTMGQVTNLLPVGSENLTSPVWYKTRGSATQEGSHYYFVGATEVGAHYLRKTGITGELLATVEVKAKEITQVAIGTNFLTSGVVFDLEAKSIHSSFGSAKTPFIHEIGGGWFRIGVVLTFTSTTSETYFDILQAKSGGVIFTGSPTDGFYVRTPMLTASYPVPYVPPGTTQTSTAHNGTSGIHYAMPQNGPVWNQLSGKPLTLAALIVMGVGSAEIPNNTTLNIRTCRSDQNRLLRIVKDSSGNCRVELNDGTNTAQSPIITWSRYQQLIVFGQVLHGGLQMRAGAKVGAGALSFGSAVTYAGSFGPDAVYSKLMLAHSNVYPVHTLKDWLADYQSSEADILATMGVT